MRRWVDIVFIFTQIAAVQAIHYILLATFVPPLLSIFTKTESLRFEGGPAQVGMIIDWRELASQPTWDWESLSQLVNMYTGWQPKDRPAPPTHWTPAEVSAVTNWTAGSIWIYERAKNGSAYPVAVPPSAFAWNTTDSTLSNAPSDPAPNATSSIARQERQLEQWEWHRTHDVRRGWAISFAWGLTVFFEYVNNRPLT